MRSTSSIATALALVLLCRGPTARAGEEAPAGPVRVTLARSVPTLLRAPVGAALRLRDGDARAVATTTDSRAHDGLEPDTALAWLFLPDGPANRPAVLELLPGRERTLRATEVVRDGVRTERFVWNDDLVFGAVAGATSAIYDRALPRFFLAKVERGKTTSLTLELPTPRPAPDARVSMRIAFAPTHEGLVLLGATWGAKTFDAVAATRSDGLSSVSFHCDGRDVPPPGTPFVVRDATASVPPTTPDDTSEDRGAVWIDSVELRAPIEAPGVPRVQVEPDVWVRLVEVDVGTAGTPHVDAPDPVAAAAGADEVILTTKATHAGAVRLAAHRSAHGVKAAAVPFADLVDRVGVGTYDETLVGRYLSSLARAGTRPRFLLLAGDADRDVGDVPTTAIPTAYGRTMYNGATASDRLLVRAGLAEGVRPPSVGRLPFSDAATMDAYVERTIALETRPPTDASRRTLRFVTSEGRFGPLVDGLIERLFTNVVATAIPPAYDVDVTFASPSSAYFWPAAGFNEHVIDGLNRGALFHTYVGHGFAQGFDALRVGSARYPILRSQDVPRVDVRGCPPVMFVVACTTATFDDPAEVSVGERLIARPHGPVAYWGATRVCHPAWNALVGRQLAIEMFRDGRRRLGEILDAAEAEVLSPAPAGAGAPADPARRDRALIELAARNLTPGTVPFERILEEGAWMYALLGDPAARIAIPRADLDVRASEVATPTERRVEVSVRGPFPDGSVVSVSLEVSRDVLVGRPAPADASADEAIRARHASANDKALARATAAARDGTARVVVAVPVAWTQPLVVKAWNVADGDVHQGAATLPATR